MAISSLTHLAESPRMLLVRLCFQTYIHVSVVVGSLRAWQCWTLSHPSWGSGGVAGPQGLLLQSQPMNIKIQVCKPRGQRDFHTCRNSVEQDCLQL